MHPLLLVAALALGGYIVREFFGEPNANATIHDRSGPRGDQQNPADPSDRGKDVLDVEPVPTRARGDRGNGVHSESDGDRRKGPKPRKRALADVSPPPEDEEKDAEAGEPEATRGEEEIRTSGEEGQDPEGLETPLAEGDDDGHAGNHSDDAPNRDTLPAD